MEYNINDIIEIKNSAGIAKLKITKILATHLVNKGSHPELLWDLTKPIRFEYYSLGYADDKLLLVSQKGQDHKLYGMIINEDYRKDVLFDVYQTEKKVFELVENF